MTFISTACVTGVVLGSYEDTRFKSESKKPLLKSLSLIGLGTGAQLEGQLAQTVQQCAGVMLARQLVNAPPNVLIPSKHLFPLYINYLFYDPGDLTQLNSALSIFLLCISVIT